MADRKQIPPDHLRPRVPGGRVRPSQRVDLRALPTVARRQTLNEQLLANTCPLGAPKETKPPRADDLQLLLQMTRERFSGAQSLLRSRAVRALGHVHALEAMEELTTLATSPVERDAIRATAAEALRALSPAVANLLAKPIAAARRRPNAKSKRRAPVKDKAR
jgi:HEAT repeat protein